MEYKRELKRFSAGDDVVYMKHRLLELGYLKTANKRMFGNDTYRAVIKFQQDNGLVVDGVVGRLTWDALFKDIEDNKNDIDEEPKDNEEQVQDDVPSWFKKDARKAISEDIGKVSEIRRKICIEAMKWAIDPLDPLPTMNGFYIRGGNAYGTNLKPNVMTKEKLDDYFKKDKYAQYFDSGRKEMMIEQSEKDGYNKIGADCSGLIVGLWRFAKVKNAGFDAAANSLYGTYCTDRVGDPTPGDLVWKNGHIGLYVGGGCVVESVGGAYGIQLTRYKKRQVYNYMNHKLDRMSPWTTVGDPKCYE